MTIRLAVGVTAVVAVACAAGAYVFSLHHFDTLLATARNTALAQSELIRVALEHQMIENDRTLIARMIGSFGGEPGVERVMILDREGVTRFSSVPADVGSATSIGSPTCQACHRLPGPQRTSSQVIETREGSLLRTVVALRNRDVCHRCHDASRRINGVLIVDVDAGAIRATMNRDLRWMAAGSGALTLVLVGAIALVVRLVVVRRLQRFETTARLIAGGDLDRRVPSAGSDTLSWLAEEFNTMADSMTGLVREVRAQQERLEKVINSVDDGIVVLDAGRRVIAANDAFLQRSGRPREQVLGSGCREPGPGACGATDCPTMACIRDGERQVRVFERRNARGEISWEEVHASPIRGPDGRIAQVVEVWRDITERRAAEAHMAEAHRLASLGLLASGFSHELNTPLATTLTCVESIQRTSSSAAAEDGTVWTRITESARIAREQLLRCRGITQHFLRLSSGKAAPVVIVDLEPTVDAVRRLIDPTARAHAVTVDVAPVAPGIHVRVSEAELQHVLLNLLLNAIQACRSGDHVGLEVAGGDPVCIRVSDTGCGIAPEQQQRIFEPFFGLRQGGTGLGLFLSLSSVRRWGGDIRVTSAPGRGSTFEVVLPHGATQEAAPS